MNTKCKCEYKKERESKEEEAREEHVTLVQILKIGTNHKTSEGRVESGEHRLKHRLKDG
jgi:hypothetical protein